MRRMRIALRSRRYVAAVGAAAILSLGLGGCFDDGGRMVVDLEVDDDVVITNRTDQVLVVLQIADGSEREVGRVQPRRSARFLDFPYVIRTEDGQEVRTAGEEFPYLITDEDLP